MARLLYDVSAGGGMFHVSGGLHLLCVIVAATVSMASMVVFACVGSQNHAAGRGRRRHHGGGAVFYGGDGGGGGGGGCGGGGGG
ncbi:hypothetical protein QJS10_CPA08g01889 [Acorus calamus]|uniref:Glycine-rich protein n=1 Tax=Acorus calamus TaxID=4465 RepID=A0AAV9EB78_ACOCL|nr:hypothetical protein QJS10_CPA08g01889 [Acorus calamus]